MYKVSLDGVVFPVAPSSIEIKINNKNKTTVLVDEGEINILKTQGLKDVVFDVLLPSSYYPFAEYEDGFKTAGYYLEHIAKLKINKKPFEFKVIRKFPDGRLLFGYKMNVSLEEYTIKDDANNGFDIVVSLKLKQFRDYGTKIGAVILTPVQTVETPSITQDDKEEIIEVEPVLEEPKPVRQEDNAPDKKDILVYYTSRGAYTWEISKMFYGNFEDKVLIEEANKHLIESGHIKNQYVPPNTAVAVPAKFSYGWIDVPEDRIIFDYGATISYLQGKN